MENRFLNFLKENKALSSYTKNVKGRNNTVLDLPPEFWINCAFEWHKTPEGVKYWDELNQKWEDTINEDN